MSIEIVKNIEKFQQLKPIWDKLVSVNEFKNIFITFDWLYTWWNNFNDEKELFILLDKNDDGEICGLAPLMKVGDDLRTIQFIAHGSADYSDILAVDKNKTIEKLLAFLSENKNQWSKINLTEIAAPAKTTAIITSVAADKNMNIVTSDSNICFSFINQDTRSSIDTVEFKKNRSTKRSYAHLNKIGALEFKKLSDSNEIKSHLNRLFQFHINRWQDSSTTSKFLNENHRNFYIQLTENLTPNRQLVLYVLNLNQSPLAYLLGYEMNDTIYLYTIASDIFYLKYSPGKIIIHETTNYEIKQGIKIIDLARGDESYKTEFCNNETITHNINFYSNNIIRLKNSVTKFFKNNLLIRKLLNHNSLKPKREKIQALVAKKGLTGFLLFIFDKMFKFIYRREAVLFYRFQSKETHVDVKHNISVKELTIDDVDKICSFLGCFPQSKKHLTILKRFEQKNRCFAAFDKNKTIVSLGWSFASDEYIPEIDWTFTLKKNEIYLGDFITSPIFRGQKIYPFLLNHIVNLYLNDDKIIYIATVKENVSSQKGIQHAGFKFSHQKSKIFIFKGMTYA